MNLKIHFKLLLFFGFVIFFPNILQDSLEHGITSEILQAKTLDNRGVSLKLYSTTSPTDPDHREVTLDLRNSDTDEFINEVIFSIQVSKNGKQFFEDSYQADEGFLILDIDMKSNTISRIENRSAELDEPYKLKSAKIQNIPRLLSSEVPGGLYDFKIEVQSLDSYSNRLLEPIVFESGLSFPSSKFFETNDPNYGKQKFGLIGYYEELYDFNYDSQEKSISFTMPYFWPEHKPGETFFVHNEILIPRTLGDLRHENFSAYVNGIDQTESVFNVDFAMDENLQVHLVTNLNQFNDLSEKLQDQSGKKPEVLEYVFVPTDPDAPLSSLSHGGRYKINLSWDPPELVSGSNTTFFIELLDIYTKDKPVPTEYHFSILYQDEEIFHESGVKIDPITKKNEIDYFIPENVSGPMTLRFENLGGGIFSNLDFPVVVNRVETISNQVLIPDWIKNNALWWSDGKIGDEDFIFGLEFLINQGILKVPTTETISESSIQLLPNWIKDTVGWWGTGKVSDQDFVNAIQYLIEHGIIKI